MFFGGPPAERHRRRYRCWWKLLRPCQGCEGRSRSLSSPARKRNRRRWPRRKAASRNHRVSGLARSYRLCWNYKNVRAFHVAPLHPNACREASVTMWALTLLLPLFSSRFLLQSSLLQSGYTSEVNAIHFPSGDQTGPAAPVEILVTCSLLSPSLHHPDLAAGDVRDLLSVRGPSAAPLHERSPVVSCFIPPPSIDVT